MRIEIRHVKWCLMKNCKFGAKISVRIMKEHVLHWPIHKGMGAGGIPDILVAPKRNWGVIRENGRSLWIILQDMKISKYNIPDRKIEGMMCEN